jgi:hypothetical protein
MPLSRPCPDDEPADLRDRGGGEDPTSVWPEIDTGATGRPSGRAAPVRRSTTRSRACWLPSAVSAAPAWR